MNRRLRNLFAMLGTVGGAVALVIVLTGSVNSQGKTIKMGFDNWNDTEAINAVAKVVLEEKLGYKVDIQPYDQGVIYAALSKGTMDVASIGYLPEIHKHHWAKFGQDIVKIGPLHQGALVGIAVPDYVTGVTSVEDLNKFRDRFEGKIYGAAPESGASRLIGEAIKAYNLNFELVTSSEPAELAEIERKTSRNEWIAFSATAPHWMWAKWKIRKLSDPKKVFGEPDGVYHLVRKGFDKDYPTAYAFYERFKMSPEQQATVMLLVKDGIKPEAAAKKLMETNPELLKAWLPQ
jgi:glycine betaine/proline transport system substrate-binding protein